MKNDGHLQKWRRASVTKDGSARGRRLVDASPPRLSLSLLGRFSLTVGGSSLHLAINARTEALIGYLAIHRNRVIARPELAENLWPDSEMEQARANLRKTLYQIRQHPWLSILVGEEGQDLRWAPQTDVVLDLAELEVSTFHQTTRLLEYARQLYQGPLLPHLDDVWIEPERRRLEQLHLLNLVTLAERYLQLNAPTQALLVAQDLVRWDPFNEEHYRLCLIIHAARQDLASLQRTYDQAEELFRRELRMSLGRETRQLFNDLTNAVRSRELLAARRESESFETVAVSTATEAFLRWLREPSASSTFYLWAPPGGGKTTWLAEAARLAQDRGWLLMRCPPGPDRVARDRLEGRRILFVVDLDTPTSSAYEFAVNSAKSLPSLMVRYVVTGTSPPESLATRRLKIPDLHWVATLDPLSPAEILALLARAGVADPAMAQEIMAAAGGLPLAVRQAIDIWTASSTGQFSAHDRWLRTMATLIPRLVKMADRVDSRTLSACSLLSHVEPEVLSMILERPISPAEYRRLTVSGLFVATPDGLALRGEVRRLLLRNFQSQEPLESAKLFRRAINVLVQEWDGRSADEREHIARECIFSIREFRGLNPEGYLWPCPGLELTEPTIEDQPAMFRLLQYWVQVQQASSSARFSREWDNLMAYRSLRLRVARDSRGEILGFNVAVPVRQDSLPVLRHSRTTGVLAQNSEWESAVDPNTRGWVLRMVVYGPKRSATVQVLLETDLLGLFGAASSLFVATPLTRYQHLLPVLGFRRLMGTARWNNGKLRPVNNYVLHLPGGFPGWVARYFQEGFA